LYLQGNLGCDAVYVRAGSTFPRQPEHADDEYDNNFCPWRICAGTQVFEGHRRATQTIHAYPLVLLQPSVFQRGIMDSDSPPHYVERQQLVSPVFRVIQFVKKFVRVAGRTQCDRAMRDIPPSLSHQNRRKHSHRKPYCCTRKRRHLSRIRCC
jgi:hypothetical protein